MSRIYTAVKVMLKGGFYFPRRWFSKLQWRGFYKKFKYIVEEDEVDHINIKISGDKQLINIVETVTPEAVRTRVEHYDLVNKENVVIKDNLSRMITSPISRFFNSKEDLAWKNDFGGDLLMKKTDLNAEEATRIVNEYDPKFVKSVVILENYWFFMTNFSYFFHNNFQIDDYADFSKIGYEKKLFGYVKLLETSELFDSVDGTFFSPFLGSSIQELPVTITASSETTSTNNRIMNQYYKLNTKNNWGFHSKRYKDKGFSPANPLSVENFSIIYSAASLVIKSFAYQKIQLKQINKLLSRVLTQDDLTLTFAIRHHFDFLLLKAKKKHKEDKKLSNNFNGRELFFIQKLNHLNFLF
ncbi:uncharacterized protein BX663DRAFT_582056 [Cokeromyces recurvatus]|uniref:uncharacterized protein n=1 Tax=Cokeromyces recurvatus TaxID=90255 RepID=UPI00221F430A|nr:uncharacterized protein BX663DRAFT_582056 [Cokeromyces recurvatus]KAI7898408.1 hypothetical protein BX663DRAFT_582056 [Cokeromyces recurvatus]